MPKFRIASNQSGALVVVLWLFSPQVGLAQTNVVAWGNDNYGKTAVPIRLTNAVAVAAGFSHSLALRPDGTVVVWGDNQFGQTEVPSGLTNALAISAGAGGFSSAGLRADGRVVVWPSTSSIGNVPTDLTDAVAIAAGTDHSLALRTNGTVSAWGQNYFGQLDVPTGLTNVVALAAGQVHSLALRADGRVAAWGGANAWGELYGPLDLTNAVAIAAGGNQSLALRADGTVAVWGDTAAVPASATNVVALAAGNSHVLALRADGTVTAWGDSGSGQASVPAGLSNVVMVAAGAYDSLAVVGSGSPFIISPLADRTAIRGSSVYFRVLASGAPPLHYQWQLNGTNMLGATANLLALSNAQLSQSGIYSLVVSNALGVASNTARLTVLPQTSRILSDSLVVSNGCFQFSAVASPAGSLWTMQGSTNLNDWVDISTLANYGDRMTFTDRSTNFTRRFYRLRLEL